MRNNRYLALRIILSIGIMAAVFYLTILSFINPNNAYMLNAIVDFTIITSIALLILFAEFDKDEVKEIRRKAYKEGYEQGKFDKEMIKHEEARAVLNELAIQTDKEFVFQDEINGYVDTIKQYITEQEKKDELLGLYKENFNFLYNQIHMGMLLDYDKYMNNFEKIKSLEEELK